MHTVIVINGQIIYPSGHADWPVGTFQLWVLTDNIFNWAIPGLFLYFRLFNTVDCKQMVLEATTLPTDPHYFLINFSGNVLFCFILTRRELRNAFNLLLVALACYDSCYIVGALLESLRYYTIEKTQLFHKGKYHHGTMPELLFDWFGFDQCSKSIVHTTYAKQQNTNK